MFPKFARHFAYEGQNNDWEGWTPPWLQGDWRERREGRGPRFFDQEEVGPRGPFGRRGFGPFGRGHHFGPAHRFFEMRRGHGPFGHGPFGPGGPAQRFFGRGDLKFALLELIQERPMHGYEMIKALEEKSGGFYVPSAGSIYPTLQMLEDRSFVTVNEVEGKKVYSITDAGRAFLAEHREGAEEFAGPHRGRGFGPGGRHHNPEMQALKSEAMEVARLLAIAGRMSFQHPEQLTKLRGIIERARKDLSDMIYATGTPRQEQAPQ
ncbi:MAG: PadR family transcriptional regulator, partial [Chloroflexota bacterium]|nr:PadR family transcriptional regulator [Chloroflexota bacterium]